MFSYQDLGIKGAVLSIRCTCIFQLNKMLWHNYSIFPKPSVGTKVFQVSPLVECRFKAFLPWLYFSDQEATSIIYTIFSKTHQRTVVLIVPFQSQLGECIHTQQLVRSVLTSNCRLNPLITEFL